MRITEARNTRLLTISKLSDLNLSKLIEKSTYMMYNNKVKC